jgi:hypothetical protein
MSKDVLKKYLKMTKDELQGLIEDYGLQDRVDELVKERDKKDGATKQELIDAIVEFVTKQQEENKEEEKDDGKPKRAKDMPINKRAQLQKADLLRKECVIVIDNQNLHDKVPARTIVFGNRLIKPKAWVVDFENETGMYLPRGVINNLKNVRFTYTEQKRVANAGGGFKEVVVTKSYPRYSIVPVEGLTEEEIKKLRAEQASKVAYELKAL